MLDLYDYGIPKLKKLTRLYTDCHTQNITSIRESPVLSHKPVTDIHFYQFNQKSKVNTSLFNFSNVNNLYCTIYECRDEDQCEEEEYENLRNSVIYLKKNMYV